MTLPGIKTRIWIGLLVLAMLALPAWEAWQPWSLTPAVSIKLLGYTNDASGTRLAVFGVTNTGGSLIYVYGPHVIDQDATLLPIWTVASARLGHGAGASFTIRTPTNAAPWMLEVWATTDVGWLNGLNRLVTRRARHMPYTIHGDWIEPNP